MKRKRHTPAEITRLLAAYRRSGLSVPKFAEKHDVSSATLYNWLSRKRKKPTVVELSATLPMPPEPAICAFRWRDGRELRFPAEISAQQLSGIVRALKVAK